MASSLEIVQGIYDAFSKGDVPSVLGAFDPGIEWLEAEGTPYTAGNPYMGPNAVLEGVFLAIMNDVDGFTVTPHNYVDGGDSVVAEGRYRGVAKVSGKAIDAQFAHVWHFQDGKVARFQQYTDSRQWSEAVPK